MSENLRTFQRALFGFDATVRRTPDDTWASPSPCEGWTAADVLAHNIGMCRMIAGFTAGVGAGSPQHDVPDRPLEAWQDAFDGLLEALDQEGALEAEAATPWGEMPVEKFLGFAWVDPLIHTWDLAVATGQPAVLEPGLVSRGVKQMERAGDSLRGERTFGPAVEPSSGAGDVERLIAITGRDPSTA